ncbi:hypothetical protein MLD38_019809 [Melastoma candidum]|uniref:Uncharacterized protein n=1 Tax=Melastoma candidum TaxID=119954 RepID=A0ACB9QBE9_9MYRT|nr:hypothetical protein MLD38_019809 [Melastoma candidum]
MNRVFFRFCTSLIGGVHGKMSPNFHHYLCLVRTLCDCHIAPAGGHGSPIVYPINADVTPNLVRVSMNGLEPFFRDTRSAIQYTQHGLIKENPRKKLLIRLPTQREVPEWQNLSPRCSSSNTCLRLSREMTIFPPSLRR